MKRTMMFLATAVSLFGFSGQAMAFFADGELVRIVYQKGGASEVATDLGAFAQTTAYSGPQIVYNTNNFTGAGAVGAFSTATWADLQVAYMLKTSTNAWVDGPAAGQTPASRMFGTFGGAATSVLNTYAGFGTAQVTQAQSFGNSYWTRMDQGGLNVGSFAGFIPTAKGEQNLAALGTTGFVDSYLYYYASPNSAVAGLNVATIRTFADGHTEVMGGAAPVPIPAPVLLLGSGLMALVGIRRKQSA